MKLQPASFHLDAFGARLAPGARVYLTGEPLSVATVRELLAPASPQNPDPYPAVRLQLPSGATRVAPARRVTRLPQ